MTRKALLLGIDAYEEVTLRLPAAKRDTESLAGALVQAGFANAQVTAIVGSQGPYLSTTNLRKQILGFLHAGLPGDELLIYFSGHGVEQAGARLLLPQDYDPANPDAAQSLLDDTRLYQLARAPECRADAVIFIIDACRTSHPLATLGNKAAPTASPDAAADTPSIAFLFSCAGGEFSHATDGDDPHSVFTRALCETLSADDAASSIDEVRRGVQQRLDATLGAGLIQTVTVGDQRCNGRGGDPLALAIKENPAARLRLRTERSVWVGALRDGPLCSRESRRPATG